MKRMTENSTWIIQMTISLTDRVTVPSILLPCSLVASTRLSRTLGSLGSLGKGSMWSKDATFLAASRAGLVWSHGGESA